MINKWNDLRTLTNFILFNLYLLIVFSSLLLLLQLKHPSALKCFEQITNHAKSKKVAVFLDYDGTLSPIVDDPDRAIMSDPVRVTRYFPLKKKNNYPVFVICTRNAEIRQFVCQMRSTVRDVGKIFPTAIISGRSRDKVVSLNIQKFYFILFPFSS